MSEPTVDIDSILTAWKLVYADDNGKIRIPIPSGERIAAFRELLKTCASYGYQRSDFGVSFRNKVIRIAVPENYPLKEKTTWTKLVEEHMADALELQFPSVVIAKLTPEELAKKVPVKTEAAIVADLERKLKSQDAPPQTDIIAPPRISKTMEDLKPVVEYDEDILKELGFDHE